VFGFCVVLDRGRRSRLNFPMNWSRVWRPRIIPSRIDLLLAKGREGKSGHHRSRQHRNPSEPFARSEIVFAVHKLTSVVGRSRFPCIKRKEIMDVILYLLPGIVHGESLKFL